jgi:hypothetical protein
MMIDTVVEAMLAVIVPGPLTVAVVEADVELAKVIEPVLLDHEENRYPEPAVAEIAKEPESTHCVPDGLVDPLPDGVTAKVTWHCVL